MPHSAEHQFRSEGNTLPNSLLTVPFQEHRVACVASSDLMSYIQPLHRAPQAAHGVTKKIEHLAHQASGCRCLFRWTVKMDCVQMDLCDSQTLVFSIRLLRVGPAHRSCQTKGRLSVKPSASTFVQPAVICCWAPYPISLRSSGVKGHDPHLTIGERTAQGQKARHSDYRSRWPSEGQREITKFTEA